MADASCSSCVRSAWAEVSHNAGVDWDELPAVQKITKTYEEETANQTRHSNSGEQFVTPCGASSRTPVYEIQFLFCKDDPLYWYIRDNDNVRLRMKKGQLVADGGSDDDMADFSETVDVKVVDQGFTWDNTVADGEEITFRFEATGNATRTVHGTGTGLPHPDGGITG
jgi:hypothetical protein